MKNGLLPRTLGCTHGVPHTYRFMANVNKDHLIASSLGNYY